MRQFAQTAGAVALLVQTLALAAATILVGRVGWDGRPRVAGLAVEQGWAIALAGLLGVAVVAAIWSRGGSLLAALLSTVAVGVGLAHVLPDVSDGLFLLASVSIGAWLLGEIAASSGAELRGRSRRMVGVGLGIAIVVVFVGVNIVLLTTPAHTLAA